MSFLPVNKKEYEYSVLITDFISKMRKYFDDENISDYKFIPLINSYEIIYCYKEIEHLIRIKRNIFNGLKFRKYENGVIKTMKMYSSYSPSDNDTIVDKISE